MLRKPDPRAVDTMVPDIYDQLREIAQGLFRSEPSQTLQPTAIVNEVFLLLIEQTQTRWQNPGEALGVAALMMRRILVDHARGRRWSLGVHCQERLADRPRVAVTSACK